MNKGPQDYNKIRGTSGSEHGEQKAFFALVNDVVVRRVWDSQLNDWGKRTLDKYDVEVLTYAVPNGASTGGDRKGRAIQGAKLKAEGMRRGVPDVQCDWPVFNMQTNMEYSGLRIEMKVVGGDVSEFQERMHKALVQAHFKVVVCYSFEAAAQEFLKYLNGVV